MAASACRAGVLCARVARTRSATALRVVTPRAALSTPGGGDERDWTTKRKIPIRDFKPEETVEQQAPSKPLELQVEAYKVMVEDITPFGFVVGGLEMQGSILCLPRTALLWKPRDISEVTIESLELVTRIHPYVEILVLGCGDEAVLPDPALIKHFREKGIVVEQMATDAARDTFNLLNGEDRRVVGAFIHPDGHELVGEDESL